nr:hypothetical protein [Tanacetum cinerariifolium]
PEWQRFVTLVKQSQELKHVSYHKLYDILKQHQHEVNDIRAKKIARVTNPLALVTQQQVYHPQTHPTHFNQNSSTRKHQAATKNRGKAVVNSPQPTYDQEPSMVDDDEDTRANQDNSPRIHRNAGYEGQRTGTVAGARDTVGSSMVQKSRIQCYNCKEYGHVARKCQKPKKAKDAAYHREKMLLSHYMYMAKLQQVSLDAVDSGPIFDTDPEQKIEQNDEDIDLSKERELLASLIQKLKCKIDETKNCNTLLETLNKVLVEKLKSEIANFKNKNKSLTEANNKLSVENDQLFADYKKSKAELQRRNSVEYALEMELECAKAKELKDKLSAQQDTISILKQQKDAQIKLYKARKDKDIEKVIDLENKVKVLDNIIYKTGQSV